MPDRLFWAKQRVLLTGHTGFKGAWLALWLEKLGATVIGLALPPPTTPNLFDLLGPFARMESIIGDIRDAATVASAVAAARPSIVIHMAAQPLVRRSYRESIETFETNVMGTAHILNALRYTDGLRAILVVTSDKVYRNDGSGRAFVEDDPLGGNDPYSASKAATEIVVSSWKKSFFSARATPVATARAGNVIGGGDWAEDRLIPDLWRAALSGQPVTLRYPQATRPWQHVLEPLSGYLAYVEALANKEDELPGALNFGPAVNDTMRVIDVAQRLSGAAHIGPNWVIAKEPQPPESPALVLNSALAGSTLGWQPKLKTDDAIAWTADWYREVHNGASARAVCLSQIEAYERLCGAR